MMKADDKLLNILLDDLREHEGCKYEIYLDHLGNRTCGVGHLITQQDKSLWGEPVGTPVSEKQVDYLLLQDCGIAWSDARVFLGPEPWQEAGQKVWRVLTNMAFQLGYTRLSQFKRFKAAILLGDLDTAAKEMRDSRWYQQTPNRVDALIKILLADTD